MSAMRPVVSVAVAACNAESNIAAIVRSISSQCQEHVHISEIIVHSDQSSDRTVAIAMQCADSRLKIVDRPDRCGFATSVISILGTLQGDALVLLNDDIKIPDDRFVERAVLLMLDEGAGLVGANVQPLPAQTFVERASVSVFRVWERIRESMPDPNNIFTCDGAALCLSAAFARSIRFPVDPSQMGNVDAFLYFSCIQEGFRYAFCHDAVIYVRSPATLADYLARNIRNDSQRPLLEPQFGAVVASSFRTPLGLYWKSVAIELLKNPLGAAFVLSARFYIRFKAQRAARSGSQVWNVIKSSKKLD